MTSRLSFRRTKPAPPKPKPVFGGVYCGPASDILNAPNANSAMHRHMSLSVRGPSGQKTLNEPSTSSQYRQQHHQFRRVNSERIRHHESSNNQEIPVTKLLQARAMTMDRMTSLEPYNGPGALYRHPSLNRSSRSTQAALSSSREPIVILRKLSTPVFANSALNSAKQPATPVQGGQKRILFEEEKLRGAGNHDRSPSTPIRPIGVGVTMEKGDVIEEIKEEVEATTPMARIRVTSRKAKCAICKKKCSGDILRADDRYFHIACFQCKTCHRSLSEVGYFEHNGDYYCPSDYQAQFGRKCPICREFAEGQVVNCQGEVYHQKCFKCTRCSKAFADGEKVSMNGREHLCTRCVQVPVAHVKPQAQTQPQAPPEMMEKKLTSSNQNAENEVRPISPPGDTQQPTTCAECNQLIHSGQVLMALNNHWHIFCFKCTCCQSVLHGEYMAKDGKPYCIRDYNHQFGVRCFECDQYIAGHVLQAGQYQFHPGCVDCSRCADTFTDGEELYMQGDEIWHAKCDDRKPPDNIMHGSKSPRGSYAPKYTIDFGKHLSYMYLIPEPEMGYLRQPINPHPPLPEQFHIPKGPVKIRKSRVSMLKTGMQKLTEQMHDENPRAHSPTMENEEPIEMSHYPGGHAPEGGYVHPIDRDDFPAPPFPYAVEELKRRLSTSSVEEEDSDEADCPQENQEAQQKFVKQEQVLRQFENESSIAHLIKTDLSERAKRANLPLHWDPRSASRVASASKMPHLRCRYETGINASPSRYENRPRPWESWLMDDRAATMAHVGYDQAPRAGYGLAPKSSTLPVNENNAFYPNSSYDTTDSRHNTTLGGGTLSPGSTLPPTSCVVGGTAVSLVPRTSGTLNNNMAFFRPAHPGVVPKQLRTSLPDMSKPPKIYTYEELTSSKNLPDEVDRCHLERHLCKSEFEQLFGMMPIEFYKLPDWKRINMKRKAKLF